MNIAIDWDGTFTVDAELWLSFIKQAKSRGHRVWIVTCRRDTEDNREDVGKPGGCLVVFTNLAAKRTHMERLGLKVDVWVDDDVECIWRGK